MQKIITTERIPIKLWLDEPDKGSLDQAKNLANLPFAFKHICLMPDAHQGYGMPIGGILATENVIVPNAVGVDIGCGMCFIETNIEAKSVSRDMLIKIMKGIREVVPLGFKKHNESQDADLMPRGYKIDDLIVVKEQYYNALKQLGTLGGGNHFIEIQKSDKGMLCIMVHSGSRNFGYLVAEHYNKLAKTINANNNIYKVNQNVDLAYFPFDTDEGQLYFEEMKYCTEFALANRKLMIERIKNVIGNTINDIVFFPMINIAHNYAAQEEHFGQNVLVHRKGATSAKLGEKGIIPGSQGSKSFIVEGLGNPESFMSCSHGAGRVMSRTAAINQLSLAEEQDKLDSLGILHSIRGRNDLEEAASAYKDIAVVMAFQDDLVRILMELEPLAVVKG